MTHECPRGNSPSGAVRSASRCILFALAPLHSILVELARTGLLDAVGDELAIECRRVDPQDLARPLLLPLGRVEHLEDVLLLELLERQRRRLDDQAAALARSQADLLGEITRI